MAPTLHRTKGEAMRVIAHLLIALSAGIGGCANFQVVSEFAQATRQVTAPVRDEMTFITTTCMQEAGLRSGFELDPEFKRIVECRGTDQKLQALQRETIDVMDLYASALLALADGKKLDLSSDIDATTKKLAAIKTKGGSSPISEVQAGALSKIVSLIADAWVQKEREKGIRMLVDSSPELAGVGKTLSSFFRAPPGAEAPYAKLVKLTRAEANAVNAALVSDFITKTDPIRAAELRMEQWKVNQALADRSTDGLGIADLMAQALDDWVESVPHFREQALRPDPLALLDRIKTFRAKAIEARNAAQSAF
jgi:hypothetical protein